MSFLERLSNGWALTDSSFAVLKKNKQLILFPVISGIALLLIVASFFTVILAVNGWDFDSIQFEKGSANYYAVILAFYVINYFILVFFNIALIHCARLYFRGEEPTIRKGIAFSISRIGVIFTWAVVAATVGTVLKTIQDRAGFIGKIIIGLVGIVWSISTFFVMPILAYEDVGPVEAVKRSARMMKQKWGESLAATFSFAAVQILAIVAAIIPLWLIGYFISIPLAVGLAIIYLLSVVALTSAVQTIFIAAVYETINNNPVSEFQSAKLDNLFIEK